MTSTTFNAYGWFGTKHKPGLSAHQSSALKLAPPILAEWVPREKAAQWVANAMLHPNVNRPLDTASTGKYREDMETEGWEIVPAPIVLAMPAPGVEVPVEGLTRAAALASSCLSGLCFYVTRGWDEKVFDKLPARVRTAEQALKVRCGMRNSAIGAPFVALMDRWARRDIETGRPNRSRSRTFEMDCDCYDHNPAAIQRSIDFVHGHQRGLRKVAKSLHLFAFVHYGAQWFGSTCPPTDAVTETANNFVRAIDDGLPGSSARQLRDDLTELDLARELTGEFGNDKRLAMLIIAWNAFLANKTPRSVKWNSAHNFPTFA
jgi:hypothetical protein